MIKYAEGGLLNEKFDEEYNLIVHGCNCFHTMGSGVAKAIKDKYPDAYRADKELTDKGDRDKLGRVCAAMIPESDLIVVNAYTQYEYGSDGKKYVDYDAVRSAMEKIKETFSEKDYKIRMPKIGAGLGGGDWEKISEIIDDVFGDREILVVTL